MTLKTLYQNPKTRIAFYIVLVLPIIVILVLLPKTKINQTSNNTVPLIPKPTNKSQEQPTAFNKNPFILDQKIIFTWKNEPPIIPDSVNRYNINTPLVNESNIVSLVKKFNFAPDNELKENTEGTHYWISKDANLFGSVNQNQISYLSKSEVPDHKKDISQTEAITTAKQIITELFGSKTTDSLETNPTVKYYKITKDNIEEEPQESNIKENNIILISFRQNNYGLPSVYKSRTGEIISIVIDTSNKLYSLNIHGGFDQTSPEESFKTITYKELQELAGTEALRITFSKDIGSERAYSDAKSVNVTVNSVGLGYFESNKKLEPVFIIEGVMSIKGTPPYPATYIVPARKISKTEL